MFISRLPRSHPKVSKLNLHFMLRGISPMPLLLRHIVTFHCDPPSSCLPTPPPPGDLPVNRKRALASFSRSAISVRSRLPTRMSHRRTRKDLGRSCPVNSRGSRDGIIARWKNLSPRPSPSFTSESSRLSPSRKATLRESEGTYISISTFECSKDWKRRDRRVSRARKCARRTNDRSRREIPPGSRGANRRSFAPVRCSCARARAHGGPDTHTGEPRAAEQRVFERGGKVKAATRNDLNYISF